MKWFRNLKIKSKMLVSFGLVVLMVVFLAVYAIIKLRGVDDDFTYAIHAPMEAEMQMTEFLSATRELRRIVSGMIMYAPKNDAARVDAMYKSAIETYDEIGVKALNDFEAALKNTRLNKADADSIASAIILPTSSSPAEIAATFAI